MVKHMPLRSAACGVLPSSDPYLQAIGSRQCKAQWSRRASESEARWKLQKEFPGGSAASRADLPQLPMCFIV